VGLEIPSAFAVVETFPQHLEFEGYNGDFLLTGGLLSNSIAPWLVCRASQCLSYPHHVTQRGVRSMDVFHSEVDRRVLIGRDLSKARPGRPRKRPCKKTVLCPPNTEYRKASRGLSSPALSCEITPAPRHLFIQGGRRILPVAILGGKTTTRLPACH
jgi:hypothetical protein